ncbi:MAG: fimbria/pilus periplasmic chaperone [Holosporales bacterium]|nr:fimbria/pilus periplasmic chaperone [Holosporales bacterium]
MKNFLLIGRFFSFCLLFYLSEVSAMGVIPFVHSFNPGKGNVQYSLTNSNSEPIAFEVRIFKRKHNMKGEDILEKDTNSFTVFPSQVIVPGNSSRNVKVKWIGNKDFQNNSNQEQAFRVAFEQFHISLDKKKPKNGATLDIRLRVLASLYMTPAGAQERFKVVSVKENGNGYSIRVKNEGTAHGSTDKLDADVSVFGKKYALKNILRKEDQGTVILAGGEREYVVTQESVKASQTPAPKAKS